MVHFQLSTYCNRNASRGEPGNVVEISEEEAAMLESLRSGRRLEVETADDVRPQVAEQAERTPRRRKKAETADDAQAEAAETKES